MVLESMIAPEHGRDHPDAEAVERAARDEPVHTKTTQHRALVRPKRRAKHTHG
jgi:hypothetical protein